MNSEPSPAAASTDFARPQDDEEAMRLYAAILGRRPTVDPLAPDVLPDNGPGVRGVLREELGDWGRALQLSLRRRPAWREVMEAMTEKATRRLDDARRRLSHGRDKAA